MPPQGALWQEALSEGTIAGGPHRGLRDGLDPPHGEALLPPRRKIPQRQLLGALFLFFLIPDVLPDDGLIEADGTHTSSPWPSNATP